MAGSLTSAGPRAQRSLGLKAFEESGIIGENIYMKRAFLILAVSAAMTAGLKAQEVSFDSLMSELPRAGASAAVVPAPAAVEREWLVLVFINGVNDLGILGFADKDINEMEQAGSTDKMAVLVEYGILGIDDPAARNLRFQRGSKTIYITRDADVSKITSPVIYTSNDADMGSAANLVRFVKRGMRRSTSVSVKFSPVSQCEMLAKSFMLAGLLREVAITSAKRPAL